VSTVINAPPSWTSGQTKYPDSEVTRLEIGRSRVQRNVPDAEAIVNRYGQVSWPVDSGHRSTGSFWRGRVQPAGEEPLGPVSLAIAVLELALTHHHLPQRRTGLQLVSQKRKDLVRQISALTEATNNLEAVLVRYKRAINDLATHVEEGESVLEAFDELDGAMLRQRELTETFDEFEAARHQVRLAVFALATAQGASMSELGRRLGISRQLASRLAAEAEDTNA